MYSTAYHYSPRPQDSDNSYIASEEEEEDSDDFAGQYEEDCDGQRRGEYTEIKEQMYRDKLAHLKRQLERLNDGTLPEYERKLRRLEGIYRERVRISGVIRDLDLEMVDRDYVNEKRSAQKEFSDQKIFLKETLISELEEKQRHIETERHNMELTGDTMDLKPITTRKLRRRANETSGAGGGSHGGSGYGGGDKRSGLRAGGKSTQPSSLVFLLNDSDISEDLKIINKNRSFSVHQKSHSSLSDGPTVSGGSHGLSSGFGAYSSPSTASTSSSSSHATTSQPPRDIRLNEGKLFYEKRWFRRGQTIQVEMPKTGEKFPAVIAAIGSNTSGSESAIWVRKNDATKIRIHISSLVKGKYILKRKAV